MRVLVAPLPRWGFPQPKAEAFRAYKRGHPVQQEKQAKVTLKPEENVRGSSKEQGNALQRSSAFLVWHEYKRFGEHAAPITAGPAAPFFQNVSASLNSSAI